MSASHPFPTKVVIPLLPKNEHVCTRSPWAEMEDFVGNNNKNRGMLVFYRGSLDLPPIFVGNVDGFFCINTCILEKWRGWTSKKMEVFWFRCFFPFSNVNIVNYYGYNKIGQYMLGVTFSMPVSPISRDHTLKRYMGSTPFRLELWNPFCLETSWLQQSSRGS